MSLSIKMPIGLSGYFKIDVLSAGGKVKRSTGWMKNLVTDIGLARMKASNNTGWPFCRVGTGNTAPDPSDQALASQLASQALTSESIDNVNIPGGYAYARATYQFAEGAVVGNVAEVGTGWAATGNSLFSRALVLDSMGNPTTITVQSDEILRVVWEHRRYWPTETFSGTIENIGNHGGTYSWTAKAAAVGSWGAGRANGCGFPFATIGTNSALNTLLYFGSSDLGDITGNPTGTPGGSGSISAHTVSSGNTARARLSFTLAQSNGSLRSIRLFSREGGANPYNGSHWQFRFDPAIPKTSSDLLAIDLDFSWERR